MRDIIFSSREERVLSRGQGRICVTQESSLSMSTLDEQGLPAPEGSDEVVEPSLEVVMEALSAPPDWFDASVCAAIAPPLASVVDRLDRALASETHDLSLADELEASQWLVGAMREQFRHELTYQHLDEEEEALAADASLAFHAAEEHIGAVRSAAAAGDIDLLLALRAPLVTCLQVLTASLERLKAADEGRPLLSPIPAVNALLRVAQAVRDDRLTFDVIEGRLSAIDPVIAQARASLGRPGGDHPLLAPLLEAHAEALEALRACAVNEDTNGLDDAMAAVRDTAQALFDAQPARTAEGEAVAALCPFCGGALENASRLCSTCGARLPERVGEASSIAEAAPSEALPDYAQEIVDLVERLHAGELCLELLHDALVGLRGRTEQALGRLGEVPSPTGEMPDHERVAWAGARSAMERGLEQMAAAVETLEAACGNQDAHGLDLGVARLRGAIKEMRELPHIVDRLVALL